MRPTWSDDDALAEHDPYFAVTSTIPQEVRQQRRAAALSDDGARRQYLSERAEGEGLNALLGAVTREPLLEGQQNNLYLPFITNCWRRQSPDGVVTLLHPDGFLSDPKAPDLRQEAYCRYRRHFHFINETQLFTEISHTTEYGVHVYGSHQESPQFLQAAFLYHPSVVDRSLAHDGSGEMPGRKLAEGGWDLRPHAERLVRVDSERLEAWAAFMGYDDALSPPVVKTVTTAESAAAESLGLWHPRLGEVAHWWVRGMEESAAERAGLIRRLTDRPSLLGDAVLQGPHIGVSHPFVKEPRSTGLHQQDYEAINPETIGEALVPRTNWQRSAHPDVYLRLLEEWGGRPYTSYFRAAARKRIASNTARSLFVSLVPPGPSATNICYFGKGAEDRDTTLLVGVLSSLLADFFLRITDTTDLTEGVVVRLPAIPSGHTLADPIIHRVLRLNCLTRDYASIWERLVRSEWCVDDFVCPERATRSIASPPPTWDTGVPVRTELDRWLLLTELDALCALILGVESDALAAVYNSQFPVLRIYEHQMVFDDQGRQLCGNRHQHGHLQARLEAEAKQARRRDWVKYWDRVQAHQEGDTGVDLDPFVAPFEPADRVAAMTTAYDVFCDRYGLTGGASA